MLKTLRSCVLLRIVVFYSNNKEGRYVALGVAVVRYAFELVNIAVCSRELPLKRR